MAFRQESLLTEIIYTVKDQTFQNTIRTHHYTVANSTHFLCPEPLKCLPRD
ncbi:hypothetical protein Lser_V15G20009 [Lactuca serriola]